MGNPLPPGSNGTGLNNTLLRSATPGGPGNTPRLFQGTVGGTPAPHPYLQDQLLAKLFNNVTTRSNVFAVWVTVGFFEVTDSNSRPVKLGAEIGKKENRQMRHKMFAIIDRSSLATEKNNPNLIGPPPVFINGSNYNPAPGSSPPPYDPSPAPILPPPLTPPPPNSPAISIADGVYSGGNPTTGNPPATLTGSYDGIPWGIQAYQPPPVAGVPPIMGTNLLIDTGASQELVNVFGIDQPPAPAAGYPPPAPRVILNGKSALAHTGPLAVTPVNTISAYTLITMGNPGPVPVGVSAVSGVFEGAQWALQAPSGNQPGTTVVIDVGTNQEAATVQAINQVGPGQYSITLQPANPTGMFLKTHDPTAQGAYTISYPIPVLGNPGPQTTFDRRKIPWVVRYFSIIN